jgi:hypothetical protein
MSTTTTELAPGLTAVDSPKSVVAEFACACGRTFTAKTDSRLGVTISNANRHAGACPAAVTAELAEAVRPLTSLSDAGAAAVESCRALAAAGAELKLTPPTGKVGVMVRTSLEVRHSTDGRWIVAKGGADATDSEPWALYRTVALDTDDGGHLVLAGTFPTCTAAFAADNLR